MEQNSLTMSAKAQSRKYADAMSDRVRGAPCVFLYVELLGQCSGQHSLKENCVSGFRHIAAAAIPPTLLAHHANTQHELMILARPHPR
jgi:hypothetical protein